MKFLMDLETGISQAQVFREGTKVLYIGEPTEINIPTIEWTFGKYASAMHIDPVFRKRMEVLAGQCITEMNTRLRESWISTEEKAWLTQLHDLFVNVYITSQKITIVKDFPQHAEHWKKVLEAANTVPPSVSSPIVELGQKVCTYGYRGFYDIGLWNTIIVPKLQIMRKEMIRQGIIYDQVDENMSSWEQVYLQKFRPASEKENPNIQQSVFPQIPARDRTIDRIIASWSMSTHAFGGLDYDGFMICWNEIHRVLTDGGDAYIFPLGTQTNEEDFQRSLEGMKQQIGMRYMLLNTYGQEVSTFPAAYTMRVIKM